MRKIILWLMILMLSGCVTVKVPKYINEEFTYRRTLVHSFNETFVATSNALKDLGWKISETTSPLVTASKKEEEQKQVLIFTEIRQTPLLLISTYSSLNAYIREMGEKQTQVEIRYLSVLSLPFKNVNFHQNDALITKIFDRIESNLKK